MGSVTVTGTRTNSTFDFNVGEPGFREESIADAVSAARRGAIWTSAVSCAVATVAQKLTSSSKANVIGRAAIRRAPGLGSVSRIGNVTPALKGMGPAP